MSTSTQTRNEPASGLKQKQSASASAVQSGPSFRTGNAMNYKAWVAKAAKQPMVLETVDLGPLGAEDVEVAVEHSGLCHSDLSVLNNDWGISQYPAILGHEVVGRVTALGPNAKGLKVGQRVGVGWNSASCMHCRQCMSGNHHLCPQVQPTIVGHRGGFATHVRAHWAWAIPLPEKLNFAEAGPLLCGGITVFAPLVMYVKPTDRVGIIGIGGLGHMAVKFAAAYGCDVTAFTSSESKFEEAKGFGANHVVSSKDSAAIKKLGGRFDLLISTVNAKLDWDALIGTLRAQRPLAPRRRRDRAHPGRGVVAHCAAAQRLGFTERLAGVDCDDARLRCTAQRHAADRALPDEQDQRGLRPTGIRQGPLPHRARCGFLIRLSGESFLVTRRSRGKPP